MPRLAPQTLSQTAPGTALPAYDRNEVRPGIVHLGIGAFHRAHMAVYLDALLADDPFWGIVGASLRRPDTKEALAPQKGLYTLAVRDASGTKPRVIGSILDVLDANTQRTELLELMASEDIRIVSLTVTEKGYCHDPATGELDEKHPDVLYDLEHPHEPRSAPGIIVEALARRYEDGIAPFAVMSCDNLPSNGVTTRKIIVRFAKLRDKRLGSLIEEEVVFPSTMVDRIVPATTDTDRAEIAALTGLEDAWPVVTEPFTQWVIENNFPGGRPNFEAAGAEMVADVEPYERMKLRMLNGSHSTLAYLGYLAGYQYVAEAIRDAAFRTLIHDLMTEEVMPTLGMERAALERYRDQLLDRFANPALNHRLWQIAMDGSQKLPQRLLHTIRGRLRGNHPVDRLTLGVAAWMRYVTGVDEQGAPIEVKDPLAERLRRIADSANRDPHKLSNSLLGVAEVFGDDLPRDPVFINRVTGHLEDLFERGAASTVRAVASIGFADKLSEG
jgi:fructuronate reductase